MWGLATFFYVIAFRNTVEVTTVTMLFIGFGFLITFAGIVLIFKDLSKVSYSTSELGGEIDPSDIAHAVRQLGKNYDILRRQATQGFILAGTFMALGILVILVGALGEMFGFTQSTSNFTIVAGVIVEVISGLGLYMFKQTFQRLNSTSDKLYEMWKILAAFTKAATLPEKQQAEVKVNLINRLVDDRSDR